MRNAKGGKERDRVQGRSLLDVRLNTPNQPLFWAGPDSLLYNFNFLCLTSAFCGRGFPSSP